MNSILTCFHTLDVNGVVDAGPPSACLLPLFFLKLKEQTSPTWLVRGSPYRGSSPLSLRLTCISSCVRLRTPSPDCLWTLAIVPFLLWLLVLTSLLLIWLLHSDWSPEMCLKIYGASESCDFPQKRTSTTPSPIEFSTHADHIVPIRDRAINTSGWVPGVWGLLCLWFSLIYRTVVQGLQWESGPLLLRKQYSSVFDLISKQTWASPIVKICCWTTKDARILGLQRRRIQSRANDKAWSLRTFV